MIGIEDRTALSSTTFIGLDSPTEVTNQLTVFDRVPPIDNQVERTSQRTKRRIRETRGEARQGEAG